MRVLVAFDKFKDALTAAQACEAAARAIRNRHPDWSLDLCPLADGGDGFATILAGSVEGRMERAGATGLFAAQSRRRSAGCPGRAFRPVPGACLRSNRSRPQTR